MGKLRNTNNGIKQNKAIVHKKINICIYFLNAITMIVIYIVLFFSCNVYKGGRGTVRRLVGKTASVMLRLTVSQCQANVHIEYSGNTLPKFARGPRRPRGSERSGLAAPSPFNELSCATVCPRPRVCVSVSECRTNALALKTQL